MECCLLPPEVGQLAVQGVPQAAEGAQVNGPQVTGPRGRGQVIMSSGYRHWGQGSGNRHWGQGSGQTGTAATSGQLHS